MGQWVVSVLGMEPLHLRVTLAPAGARAAVITKRFCVVARSADWRLGTVLAEVTTDRPPAYPRILDELIPSAPHTTERYANSPAEADHGRLKPDFAPCADLRACGCRKRLCLTFGGG